MLPRGKAGSSRCSRNDNKALPKPVHSCTYPFRRRARHAAEQFCPRTTRNAVLHRRFAELRFKHSTNFAATSQWDIVTTSNCSHYILDSCLQAVFNLPIRQSLFHNTAQILFQIASRLTCNSYSYKAQSIVHIPFKKVLTTLKFQFG